jgi:beta-glucosidase
LHRITEATQKKQTPARNGKGARGAAAGAGLLGRFLDARKSHRRLIYGCGNRFGIVYVDFKTQKRTPKLSVAWFCEAARRNAVV